MKCAEVMEWMHRYIDHDLSQDESLEMFRHIDNCPSCAEVFDRLTMLSRQLEELPDVKPPFSLVDSILPQLEELDRGGREEPVAAVAEESKVIPFARKNTHGKKPKGSSLATRTGIGAAAAAVILLFAIFKMPGTMPAADMGQALTSSANEASSRMMNESADTAAPAAAGQNSGEAGSPEVFFTEQTPAAADTAPAELNNTVPADGESAGNSAPEDPGPVMGKQSPAADAVPGKRNVTSPPPAAAGGGNNNSAADSPADSQIFSAKIEEGTAADTALPEEGAVEPGAMGLLPALTASQPSWPSPDGRYAAELAGQQLVIYSSDPAGSGEQERTAVTSLPLEGTFVSGEWSADGSGFTYVTQLQDGTQVSKVYAAPAVTASPAPSASAVPESSAGSTPDAAAAPK
ncbi:anti-sigma factor [Paenibacillus sp. MMS20-IR301]|uniref:anti-sigma factor family protein n=1 Tax=Paenibacillus sp. MMS20-IR301 TaxID=2895946 RepID=UPI0028E41C16|nr:anti-sigma factor [Paenibacillus sp. MMS20-IR301]WNS43728.1 anti-sigma factor [Paenibacillus sp. MMS20-IR301]